MGGVTRVPSGVRLGCAKLFAYCNVPGDQVGVVAPLLPLGPPGAQGSIKLPGKLDETLHEARDTRVLVLRLTDDQVLILVTI